MGEWLTWAAAMQRALVGPGGFYRGEAVPAAHFRTSVTAAPHLLARAVAALLDAVGSATDQALGQPLSVVDLGAGGGELLTALVGELPAHVQLHGIEVAPRPPSLPARVTWSASLPAAIVGIVIAHEYLDNIPVDVAEVAADGIIRLVMVDPTSGVERLAGAITGDDAAWCSRWWPLVGALPGARAEIGRARDEAWAAVVRRVQRGIAVAIDYDHGLGDRPLGGTLTAYRKGRVVAAIPDGSCDITAHVALDACSAAGRAAGATTTTLVRQADALRALGLAADRPTIDRAREDPLGYLRALSRAGAAAELLDRGGLGAFGWLVQGIGVPVPERLARIG